MSNGKLIKWTSDILLGAAALAYLGNAARELYHCNMLDSMAQSDMANAMVTSNDYDQSLLVVSAKLRERERYHCKHAMLNPFSYDPEIITADPFYDDLLRHYPDIENSELADAHMFFHDFNIRLPGRNGQCGATIVKHPVKSR